MPSNSLNIYKELVKPENRHILRSTFENLNGFDRVSFFFSGIKKEFRKKTKVCNNCFKYPVRTHILWCSMGQIKPNHCFHYCDKCWSRHIDTNTKIMHIRFLKDEIGRDQVDLVFSHSCKNCGPYSYPIVIHSKALINETKRTMYETKPSLFKHTIRNRKNQ